MAYAKSKGGIYCILNLETLRHYIGSSKNLHGRMKEHFNALNRNKHSNRKLQRSFNKRGSQSFRFDVIEVIKDEDKLIEREQFWINNTLPYYNLRKSARSNLGFRHSEETKKKMSKSSSGRRHSDETKANLSLIAKGREFSEETRLKIGLAGQGRKHSEETKRKMRLARVGFKYSEESRLKMSESRKAYEAEKRKIREAKLIEETALQIN